MKQRHLIILIVVAVVVLLFAVGGLAAFFAAKLAWPVAGFGNQVALVRVEGMITSGRGGAGLFGDGEAGSERIVKLLDRARRDSSVQSLVVRINSPGGSAVGSQEIYQAINRVRRARKKVTVSMGDVAASGGYYVASAADRIFAQPATLTGSIGVIMTTADMHELFDKLGINLGAVKSGEHKDMGSIARPMTPDERRIAQAIIDDVFDQFVTDVSAGRKLKKGEVIRIADGRVYTGRQALKLRLVDKLGSLQDALRAAADDAGIKGEFNVVEYERPGLLSQLFRATDTTMSDRLEGSGPLGRLARRLLLSELKLELR